MITERRKQKVQVVAIAQGQLLLLEFAEGRGKGFQNITGSVEDDESFLEGARRELLEETGIAENVIDLQMSFTFSDRWGFDVEEKVFLYRSESLPVIHLSEEHKSFKWISLALVKENDFAFPSNYQAFVKALEFIK